MTNQQTFQPSQQIGVGGLEIGPLERKYVNEVLDSSRLSHGPFSQRFESLFAGEHDCRYACFLNSGTSALHIALAVLKERHGWQDGDEVLVPAVTFISTANIVIYNGMRPVFVDVDSRTYNMDPAQMEEKITGRTRAVIPVHLFGLPAQMDAIMEVADRRGLRLIEDSCETMFATCGGKKVGSFGDIGCFSTYVAHILVTGVGGFCTTNDPQLAVMLKSSMNHRRDEIYLRIDDDKTEDKQKLFEMAARRFRFVRFGHSFRATELEAAIGLAQLEQKEEFLQRRRRNALILTEGLKHLDDRLQLPTVPENRTHAYMMFPMVLRDAPKRELVNYLEERKIETRDMLALLDQPIYRKIFGDMGSNFPVANWINESGFYVGCHPYLKPEELEYVVQTIGEYFG
ncbi:DegT/DnrJ/EryC1/StrS family aminotransferase [bacterium]|nr:DegT/DnrJ/EryC1/StrS family aminotransferase [bacterium]